MDPAERSVLHVLPHPGGGGATYVDHLEAMHGYRFARTYLGSSPKPGPRELSRGVANALRRSRDADLIHVHGEAAGALCMPALVARPSVVTLNGLHLVRRTAGARGYVAALNLRVLLRAADRTICVSRAEFDYLGAAVGASAGRRAVVIHNGTPSAFSLNPSGRGDVRLELGLGPDDPVAIWVGSLDHRKDPLAAIRAAEQASVRLLVVGDGPLRNEVESSSADSVRILGQRDDTASLFAASDFYVMTSRREGLAFALLEAMAAGLPALVWAIPENVEAVGDAGITVPVGDHAELVAGFRRLGEGRAEREALGERARQRVARLFDADQMARRTRAVYDELFSRV